MKVIGKEVNFIGISKNNPRNGEGSFIKLKNGDIVFAYTDYYSDDGDDAGLARISAICSKDNGETWSEPYILVNNDINSKNYMSVSFVRFQNDSIGLFYLRKSLSESGGIYCMPQLLISNDELITFSKPIEVISKNNYGYYVMINDGVIICKNGDVICPLAKYEILTGGILTKGGEICFFISKDNGLTWEKTNVVLSSPYGDKKGYSEPGLYEYNDGSIWLYLRTAYGYQYSAYSTDKCQTFSEVRPNFCFSSPDSPMRVRKIANYTVAISNPFAYNPLRKGVESWNSPKRTPLLCSISSNDGKDFITHDKTFADGEILGRNIKYFLLESDESESYSYPSFIETDDGFLVAYYHSSGTTQGLSATRIKKVYFSEIE